MFKWTEKDMDWARKAGHKIILVCGQCGWFVSDPRITDDKCPNCSKSYHETESERIQVIR